MTKPLNPTDLARETLKQLAVRRVPPTPDHYEAIYHEVAKTPEADRLHPGLRAIVSALGEFPNQSPELKKNIEELRKIAQAENWAAFPKSLFTCVSAQSQTMSLSVAWAELIRDLIKQWDLRNPSYTPSRKKLALDKVLANFGKDPVVLNEKLASLIRAWSETGKENDGGIETGDLPETENEAPSKSSASSPGNAPTLNPNSGSWADWRNALVQSLHLGAEARLAHNPELQEEAVVLANEASRVDSDAALQALMLRLRKFWLKLELQNDQEMRLCDGLLNLLRLLTDNMAEVVIEDEWVQGQIAVIQAIMSSPLDMRLI